MTGVSSDIVKGLKVQTNLSYDSYAMLLNFLCIVSFCGYLLGSPVVMVLHCGATSC